jgi:RNase H-fold protein (predicted Holliday junction resolvase)
MGKSAKKQRSMIDQQAAVEILETALSAQRTGHTAAQRWHGTVL